MARCNRTHMTLRGFLLAMLALIGAQFSPAGFMPAQAQDGTFVITICTGSGPVTRTVSSDDPLHEVLAAEAGSDDTGSPSGDRFHDETKINKQCEFAGGAGAIDIPPSPVLVAACIGCIEPTGQLPRALTGIFPQGLPPATGPPVLS